ncbi:hypothetical protein ABQF29_22320, partial [Mycolicibacter minnesotensis]
MLAHAIRDGFPAGRLRERFPIAANLVRHGQRSCDKQLSGRLAGANAVALQLGWLLLEPFSRPATGIEDLSSADLRQSLMGEITRVLKASTTDVYRIAFPVSQTSRLPGT